MFPLLPYSAWNPPVDAVKKNEHCNSYRDLPEVLLQPLQARGPLSVTGLPHSTGRRAATGKSLLGIPKDPVGGIEMSVKIKRITLWRIEVENKPGV